MVKRNLPELARSYFGGLTHAHTVLSNHTGHHESDLTIDRIVATMTDAELVRGDDCPFEYIMLNEHPSDPAQPRRLGRFSPRGRRLLKQRRRPTVGGVHVLYGLEVSFLPNGLTDLTPRLNDHCALVIASRHSLPRSIEHNTDAISELFESGCHSPVIGVLGHPPRYIENNTKVNWERIFNTAAKTGTAIEINLNTFPNSESDLTQHQFWAHWLTLLARSKAPVFIGTDLHNHLQLGTFIHEWGNLGQKNPEYNHVAAFVTALDTAGISPGQVVTRSYETLTEWLALDKAGRAKLCLTRVRLP